METNNREVKVSDDSPNWPRNQGDQASRNPTFLVGVGASAGGLEALERLFEAMPTETGMAFVVVQHLSPDFKSLTDELLARRTRIPIRRAENGMEIERDCVYVLPPRKEIIVSQGRLLLTDKDPAQGLALPIDHFFRSLAQDAGTRAIGIILSGTGSDGSRGIRDIHEAGGIILVQDSESAKFDGMPKSALATGLARLALRPEEMPEALIRYIGHPSVNDLPHHPVVDPVPENAMQAIFRLLRDTYDIDFSHYKPETVSRRTERRLQINQGIDLNEYVERLSGDSEELNNLYKDLLIGVTRFLRDREAFDRLETLMLPTLIRRLPPEEDLRVWVAGCGTGEEAYSLAMLIDEAFQKESRPVRAKIFATDVHPGAIEFAGTGRYSEASLVDVNPQRLERYFLPREKGYQVSPELRRLVVFARQNVLKDSPFTRLDLITCRNLLIYFQPSAQKKVISLFHFGLKTSGYLFLGPSESPGELSDEFESVDQRWKVYRKRRDVRLPTEVRLATPPQVRSTTAISPSYSGGSFDPQLLGCFTALLDKFMPTCLLVNEQREVVYSFGEANCYLRPRSGRFSADLLDMVDGEFRIALTGALQQVFKEQRTVAYKALRIASSDVDRVLNVKVEPLSIGRINTTYALITLEELNAVADPVAPAEDFDFNQATHDQMTSMETELRHTKENLQATIEELETSNEELQATNEELVAANEELQSTNEELHSVNEELYTVNGEYQKKINELTELTSDMENLLLSTEIHTIFLDGNLCIRKFTPRIGEAFNLLPQDVGRRIDTFSHNLNYPGLQTDIQQVLATSEIVEKQTQDHLGRWFLLRILPYRIGRVVGGVVLTLVDISNLKKAEDLAREKDRQLMSILRTSPNFICIKDLDGRYLVADDSYRRTFGVDPIGKTAFDIYSPQVATLICDLENRARTEEGSVEAEVVIPLSDGLHTFLCVRFPVRNENNDLVGISGIKMDITRLKQAEQLAQEAVLHRDRFLAMLSHELRNPLAAILNATQVVESLSAPPAAEKWSRIITRRSRHMARLLDDLLDVSRITQNKIEIRRRPLDLTTLIPDILEATQPWFHDNQIKPTVMCRKDAVWVEGDPDRLQQIQVNLLVNAAKYSHPGGEVFYTLDVEGSDAVIRVRDNGRGISHELLSRVFDLFVQANDSLDRVSGGIGVGLTLVRAIVELHGGKVEAQSAGPEQGSEFILRLPTIPAPKPPLESAPSVTVTATVRPTHSRPPILVVEDDADLRQSMKTLLGMDGYTVRVVENGPAALDALEQEWTTIALVDIGIPLLDGYGVAREIRSRWPEKAIFLVALTGYGRSTDQQAAFEAGFNAHLTKPMNLSELYLLLEQFSVS